MIAHHTPTPWTIRDGAIDDELLIVSDETCVSSVPIWADDDDTDTFRDQSHANADFIVRACNAHDTFAATLRLALRALNTAPRFRVEATDSYKIASAIEAALRGAGLSPYPEIAEARPDITISSADHAARNSALRKQKEEGEKPR